MPLASWYSHHWYPGHASMVRSSVMAQDLDIENEVRMSITNTSAAGQNLATLIGRTMSLLNTSVSSQAISMRSEVRMSLTGKIGVLTADDVTGAVLEAQIAPGLTLKQAILDARSRAGLAAALSA